MDYKKEAKVIKEHGFKTFWECLNFLSMSGFSNMDAFGVALLVFNEKKMWEDVAFLRLEGYVHERMVRVEGHEIVGEANLGNINYIAPMRPPSDTFRGAMEDEVVETVVDEYEMDGDNGDDMVVVETTHKVEENLIRVIVGIYDDDTRQLSGLFDIYRKTIIDADKGYEFEGEEIENKLKIITLGGISDLYLQFIGVLSKKYYGYDVVETQLERISSEMTTEREMTRMQLAAFR